VTTPGAAGLAAAEAYHHRRAEESPAHTGGDDRPRIVVGVDGSPGAGAALRWAVENAARVGGRVVAVLCWHWTPGLITPFVGPGPEELAAAAAATLDQALAEVGGPAEGVPIERHVLPGHPADVLPRQARGADLLVVGTRGRGALACAVLGSVSTHCVGHAPCPVIVVPATGKAAA
jgi:nucleotide-binding universal stress UspA family protein